MYRCSRLQLGAGPWHVLAYLNGNIQLGVDILSGWHCRASALTWDLMFCWQCRQNQDYENTYLVHLKAQSQVTITGNIAFLHQVVKLKFLCLCFLCMWRTMKIRPIRLKTDINTQGTQYILTWSIGWLISNVLPWQGLLLKFCIGKKYHQSRDFFLAPWKYHTKSQFSPWFLC